MKVVAFDLGSTMGWAANFKPAGMGHRRFIGSRVERLFGIQQWLVGFQWDRADVIIYETPLVRGQGATRILWGIAGLLEAAATRSNLPILDVAVPTIKKFATGSGNAPKAGMIAAAKKYGYAGENEHEADAVCLLHYAIANLERGG